MTRFQVPPHRWHIDFYMGFGKADKRVPKVTPEHAEIVDKLIAELGPEFVHFQRWREKVAQAIADAEARGVGMDSDKRKLESALEYLFQREAEFLAEAKNFDMIEAYQTPSWIVDLRAILQPSERPAATDQS